VNDFTNHRLRKAIEAASAKPLQEVVPIIGGGPRAEDFRDLQCMCGCKELEPVNVIAVKFNPTQPEQILQQPGVKLRCFDCKKWARLEQDKKGHKFWQFGELADPPEEEEPGL